MKEYLDGFLKNAKRVADVLVEKTTETVDAAKLEIEIHRIQAALDKEYKAFGQIMFQVEKGALKKDEAIIQTACRRIQENIDELIELQQKKEEAKAERKQSEEPEEDIVEEDDEEEAEAVDEELQPEKNNEGYFMLKFCPECNIGNHPDATRCVNCGAEFAKKDDIA